MHNLIKPDWPAPKNILAFTTTKHSNLSKHKYPLLEQTHSNKVLNYDNLNKDLTADACYASQINTPCTVKTADCLPILITNKSGTKIAAVHAGWRGILSGIIENSINALQEESDNLLLWFGPCISVKHFEVKEDFIKLFLDHNKVNENAFTSRDNKTFACLHTLAKNRLTNFPIDNIFTSLQCTYENEHDFYSYRRSKDVERMLSSIIITG